ncbi:toxin YdaT family protein [Atlantibacter hermannii]|uniref:toxin YdaT family protein n=1 Tax=Atlantibacter hermannii TaxID=565 RepID=UPI0028A782EE|nr:toxin YdaT family protein [Atlantibacter hermannii]
MQSLAYQQSNNNLQRAVRFESHIKTTQVDDHANLCSAVRCWANEMGGQLFVAMIVADAWREMSGEGIEISAEPLVWRTKLFRWLDNRNNSPDARANIVRLRPAILGQMPDVIKRRFGYEAEPTEAELVAAAIKECSEAHQAKLLGSPVHKLEKEVREAAESVLRFLPADSLGVVLNSLMAMIPQVM